MTWTQPPPPPPNRAGSRLRRPTSRRSSRGSRQPGRRAIMRSSAPRCRSSADLCEALDLRAGSKVLDVAAGQRQRLAGRGARRWCDVVATDFHVPALLRTRPRAGAADRLAMTFREADAEALPFPDGSFDAVVSTFGVMFTPDQPRAAARITRVCRPGGKIGLANWTPEASSANCSRPSASTFPRRRAHRPRHSGAPATGSPSCSGVRRPRSRRHPAELRVPLSLARALARNLPHLVWPGAQGVRLDAQGQIALQADILALIGRFNRSGDDTMVVRAKYLGS